MVADISYFSEVHSAGSRERNFLTKSFNKWLKLFDRGCDHIVYGSDWIMLGKEAGFNHYIESVNAFLRSDCGLSNDICDKIFRRNALRFLPLERGSLARERLLAYYRANSLDESRFLSASSRLVASLFGR